MIKKIIIPFILVLVLNSCGYSPIYSTKYQDFKIDNISFKGERKINEILRKRLVGYTKITSAENIYDVIINSSLQKNVDSKDKKGNPTQFSIRLSVFLETTDSQNNKSKINFSENITYDNSENKFDLKKYEDNLIKNMTEKIYSEMILFIQSKNLT